MPGWPLSPTAIRVKGDSTGLFVHRSSLKTKVVAETRYGLS